MVPDSPTTRRYSNRLNQGFTSPTDMTGGTTITNAYVTYTYSTGDSTTGTTGDVFWPSPKTAASTCWPEDPKELLRRAKTARFVEELRKLREQLDKALAHQPPNFPGAPGKLPRRHRLERARHGFQQMCRLPCYRGVRTR